MRLSKDIIRVLLLGLLFLAALPAVSGAAPPVAPWVQESLARTGSADFFIVLKDDPGAAIRRNAQHMADKKERHKFIVTRLQQETFRSQSGLGLWLLNQGADYEHYWIVNQILVRNGSAALLEEVLKRPEVLRVDANPRVKVRLPEPQEAPPRAAAAGAEWNIARIKADRVWSVYGVTGAGAVVAVNDSGVMWTHEALINQYRGWNGATADHTYSWHDAIHSNIGVNPCGANSPVPCDDGGHGTHVAGTMVGQAPGHQIGVAPGAKWIACRNMDQGTGTPATYLECLQWFLAPQGNVDMAPDIVNNSWSCPPSEGCAQDTLEAAVNTVTAAGLMMVAANGNDGLFCATTYYPPAIYRASFSVGATTMIDNLANFSSRGPVTYQGETYLKPDISAPGEGIVSSWTNPSYPYIYMVGTSMASPHVAGAAALLWSGVPGLRGDLELTKQILRTTARPRDYTDCGDPPGVPNNGFGWGILDALRAMQIARGMAEAPVSLMLLLTD